MGNRTQGEFKTQRELLEYLNKDPNDRKLVSRMIQRGEIIKRGGLYALFNKDDKIKELEHKIEELEHKLKDYDNLVEKINKVTEDNNRLVEEKNRLIKEKNDLINQLDQLNQLEMEENGKNDGEIINKVYKYLTQVLYLHVDKTDFVEWIEK